jgi:hypothetical protein
VEQHYAGIHAFLDYERNVSKCPSCPNGNNCSFDGLIMYYMNGDWMAYMPQAEELVATGPPMASFHFIKERKKKRKEK